MKSIAHRIYKAIFVVSLCCIAIILAIVYVVNEDLEQTMLYANQELAAPLPSGIDTQQLIMWDGAINKLAFIPTTMRLPNDFPLVFIKAKQRRQSEVEIADQTYLVNIEQYPEGTLYWARNITAFETREDKLNAAMLAIVLGVALLSYLLARVNARRIVQPLQQLSSQIQALPIGKTGSHLSSDYRDRELTHIATTFNLFLQQQHAYMQREQQLLSMASHELRTPIAVISGALDVIESRAQLQSNDQRTLQRIRHANTEMGNNVTILLQLARGTPQQEEKISIDVEELSHEIIHDISAHSPHAITRCSVHGTCTVFDSPTLVKMLLRNLIQNALQHTTGNINVILQHNEICIQDQGVGANITLPENHASLPSSGGLGLYLVTLMSEKLGWGLRIQQMPNAGTYVYLTPT